jgi:hypothetical protein
MRTMIQFFSRLAVAVLLMGPFPSLAEEEEAGACRAHCNGLADADQRACSELPPNPSCARAVEVHREQCHEFCGRQYPERSDPPQQGEVGPGKCDPDLPACR